jgi:putative membrane protein
MRHLKSTLATLSTAAVFGVAGCSNTPSANAPSGARPASTYSQYGPAMGEGAGYSAGPSTEAMPGEVGRRPPPMPSPVEMGAASPALADPAAVAAATGATTGAPVTWGSPPDTTTTTPQVGVTNQMGGMVDLSTLNDAQFAAIVQAVNAGEIQEAQLAMTKATSPDVKRFAKDMVIAHHDMQTKMTTLLGRLQITPSDNAVSNQMRSDTQGEISTLQTMRGKDFDRDYIDAQVRNHNKTLELLDHITPSVKDSELKAALTATRPKVEAHLREAERVQLTLEKGTASPQPGSEKSP